MRARHGLHVGEQVVEVLAVLAAPAAARAERRVRGPAELSRGHQPRDLALEVRAQRGEVSAEPRRESAASTSSGVTSSAVKGQSSSSAAWRRA